GDPRRASSRASESAPPTIRADGTSQTAATHLSVSLSRTAAAMKTRPSSRDSMSVSWRLTQHPPLAPADRHVPDQVAATAPVRPEVGPVGAGVHAVGGVVDRRDAAEARLAVHVHVHALRDVDAHVADTYTDLDVDVVAGEVDLAQVEPGVARAEPVLRFD